jgi:hypothetical protein
MAAAQRWVMFGGTLWFVMAAGTLAREQMSADPARQLAARLDRSSLTAIAAIDPAHPGTYVAALYIPGSQLLVVQAQHPSAAGLAHRLDNRQYRDAYLDLQATPTPEGKFFVHDAGADGIAAEPSSGAVDVVYEDGVRQTLFDGQPREQKLSPAEYATKAAMADERYARLLTLLLSALNDSDQPTQDAAR